MINISFFTGSENYDIWRRKNDFLIGKIRRSKNSGRVGVPAGTVIPRAIRSRNVPKLERVAPPPSLVHERRLVMPPTRQVKSKQRVADFGEVFTAPREVNAMLDLVASEFKRVDATFLDPACGDGNFLDEILRRKLAFVEEVSASDAEYERNALIALGSIYGVEIQDDNARECRARLLEIWREAYDGKLGEKGSDVARETAEEIVALNIVRGDFLKLQTVDAQGRDTGEPIYMYSWSYGKGRMTKKRERLQEPPKDAQPTLFDGQVDETLEESESQTSEPREEPTTPEAPKTVPEIVKKAKRSKATSVKKSIQSKSQESNIETENNALVASKPDDEISSSNILTEKPTPVVTDHDVERFAIQANAYRLSNHNTAETSLDIVERIARLINDRADSFRERSDVEHALEEARTMIEVIAQLRVNLKDVKHIDENELWSSYREVGKHCFICAGAVKGLAFLNTTEQEEIVSELDKIEKDFDVIFNQGENA